LPRVTQTLDSAPLPSEALRETVGLVVTGSPVLQQRHLADLSARSARARRVHDHAFFVTNWRSRHRDDGIGRRPRAGRIELTAYLGGFAGPEIVTTAVDRVITSTGLARAAKDTPVPAGHDRVRAAHRRRCPRRRFARHRIRPVRGRRADDS
jgi:hypothetical protein